MARETLITLRRGTSEEWTLANPTLESGEPAYETDTYSLKIGDGRRTYNTLPYMITGNGPDIELITYVETLVQSAISTSIVAPSVTHTKGNLILVFVGSYNNSNTMSVTDTMGNIYTPAGADFACSLGIVGNWFWTYAKDTGSNVVTGNVNGGYRTISVLEYYGFSAENPVDIYATNSGTTSNTFSTAIAKELILIGWHVEGASTFVGDTGYTYLNSGAGGGTGVRRPIEQKITTTAETNASVTLGHTNGTLYGSWVIALRQKAPIRFTTEAATFSPQIQVVGSPTIKWTFSDGTTSSSASPTVNFVTAATRTHTLEVTPWSSLININVGYTADDGGSAAGTIFNRLDQQSVSKITGLNNVAPYLKYFAASYNPLTKLDFTNFTSIEAIECFSCNYLASINLTNTPKLTRLCLEACDISILDLSTSPELGDLRCAIQYSSSYEVRWGSISKLWHICIRDNHFNATTRVQPWSQFPLIKEIYYGGNSLSQSEVDALLAAVDAFNTSPSGAFINMAGNNAAPSSTGLTHVANLRSRGWTISVSA